MAARVPSLSTYQVVSSARRSSSDFSRTPDFLFRGTRFFFRGTVFILAPRSISAGADLRCSVRATRKTYGTSLIKGWRPVAECWRVGLELRSWNTPDYPRAHARDRG